LGAGCGPAQCGEDGGRKRDVEATEMLAGAEGAEEVVEVEDAVAEAAERDLSVHVRFVVRAEAGGGDLAVAGGEEFRGAGRGGEDVEAIKGMRIVRGPSRKNNVPVDEAKKIQDEDGGNYTGVHALSEAAKSSFLRLTFP